ncbi:MAG: hypothetical protein K1X67_06775 [Fimbriimonadaceae bacterium]|nr:hypothetical protein [Fimbriimonadaceae bacterium]
MAVCLYVALEGFYIGALGALDGQNDSPCPPDEFRRRYWKATGDPSPPNPLSPPFIGEMGSFCSRSPLPATRHPLPATRPTIVHHEKVVLDACPHAQGRGVRIGMSLSEAKATLYEARFVPYKPEDFAEAREKWLLSCAEVSDVVEPLLDHEALIDLSGHPQPVEIADRLLRRLGAASSCGVAGVMNCAPRLGQCPSGSRTWQPDFNSMTQSLWGTARGAIARTPWVARLAADRLFESAPFRLGLCSVTYVEDPVSFLSPLPVSCLTPVERAHQERLAFLGYRTIGQVQSAPFSALKAQFGSAGVLIREASLGKVGETVQPLFPPDSVSLRKRFDGEISDSEVLERVLCDLASSLARELTLKDLQGKEVVLSFDFEDGSSMTTERLFVKPLYSVASTTTALLTLFRSLDQELLAGGVTQIRVRLPRLKRVVSRQVSLASADPRLALLRPSSHRKMNREGPTPAEIGLREAQQSFPEGTIQRASDVEEPRRKKVLRAWRYATGWY